MTVVAKSGTMNALELAKQQRKLQEEKAAQRAKDQSKYLFIFLKDGDSVRFRPLTNWEGFAFVDFHNRYTPDPDGRVNAVCGRSLGKSCEYCDLYETGDKEYKDLEPQTVFIMPVARYTLDDRKAPVSVEPKLFKLEPGSVLYNTLLDYVDALARDESAKITDCDFMLSQAQRATQKERKQITLTAGQIRAPRIMVDGQWKEVKLPGAPSFEKLIQLTTEAYPIVESTGGATDSVSAEEPAPDGFDYASTQNGVNSASKKEAHNGESIVIPDF